MLISAGGKMRTGTIGQAVIRWKQTEINGLEAAPLEDLTLGAVWSWRGIGSKLASLGEASRAKIHHTNAVLSQDTSEVMGEHQPFARPSLRIELSNGAQRFQAVLIQISSDEMPVLVFENGSPLRDQEFWISALEVESDVSGLVSEFDNIISFPDRGHSKEAEPRVPAAVAAE
ncbi:hypothetical protein [Ruegeria sp. HKCCD7255]|uniref:hypothetical protein n=1 Tax=Ruegeria sp. HKCCD7255 TaxID=2683004 RepID=UPI0014885499|nr:hypothetical protein [Ruegeria sp. HKCCD7255]